MLQSVTLLTQAEVRRLSWRLRRVLARRLR